MTDEELSKAHYMGRGRGASLYKAVATAARALFDVDEERDAFIDGVITEMVTCANRETSARMVAQS